MALPKTLPLPALLQTLLWARRPTQLLELCQRRYGHAFHISLLPFGLSLFSDPDSIRTIFAAKPADMHAGKVNITLRPVVGGASLIVLDGDEHLRHRKLLMPPFHGERMRLYGQTMADITRKVMAGWREGKAFTLHPHVLEITLEVILRTVFGADEGAQFEQLKRQMKRFLGTAGHLGALLAMVYLASRPHLENKQPWAWLLRSRAATDALLYRQIAHRRNDPDAGTRTDVLALLMQARDEAGMPMTDQELRDELVTALVAGHETTAATLAWAFERILSHPVVYGRLREELQAAGGVATAPDKIAALPYLDATIKEVLRLRPVLPLIGRMLQKPMVIGGHEIPAGAAIGACIYLAHRNPELYPQPEAFRPERFLGVQTDPASWLPFGGGVRRCIGAQFALYELKIVLATMLTACDFELAQSTPARVMRRAIMFWPEGGARVKIRRRL